MEEVLEQKSNFPHKTYNYKETDHGAFRSIKL